MSRVGFAVQERIEREASAGRSRKTDLVARNDDILEFRRDDETRYVPDGAVEKGRKPNLS